MWERLSQVWLPRLLFLGTLVLAAALAVAVPLAPLLVETEDFGSPIVEMFANDLVVRRTALACALGLAVTAFVFFRPAGFLGLKSAKRRLPPPMAGA